MSEPSVPPPPTYNPPPPPVGGSTPGQNRGLMIALSYLWILAIIPLVVEKDDPEVQWHAKHGIVLLVVEIIAWAVIFMVTQFVPFAGCVLWLAWPVFLVVRILCIVKGINGQRFMIPGISEYANRF